MVPGRHPGLHDVTAAKFGDEVLAQEADGTPLHGVEGEGVSVAHHSRDTAEEVARPDPPAVVRDPADQHGRRVPHRLNDVDVVEEEVHGHGRHGRPDSVACVGQLRVTVAMTV